MACFSAGIMHQCPKAFQKLLHLFSKHIICNSHESLPPLYHRFNEFSLWKLWQHSCMPSYHADLHLHVNWYLLVQLLVVYPFFRIISGSPFHELLLVCKRTYMGWFTFCLSSESPLAERYLPTLSTLVRRSMLVFVIFWFLEKLWLKIPSAFQNQLPR